MSKRKNTSVMRSRITHLRPAADRLRSSAFSVVGILMIAAVLGACRPGEEPGAHVAGWTMIDPAQRHPIIVSHEPASLALRVTQTAAGLTPQQRAEVVAFVRHYRGADTGDGRISVTVPGGAPNEVAVLHAITDLKDILREFGLDAARVTVQAYHAEKERHPPIRLSYVRYRAQAPHCGQWPANLAEDAGNLPFHNLGCSTQRNIAAQIANPADLLGPRAMDPNSAERRGVAWEKWTKGESTVSKKDGDERVEKSN